MVLPVAMSTILLEQRPWNYFRARKTAFSSRQFICILLTGRDQVPLAVRSPKQVPRSSLEASVNLNSVAEWVYWLTLEDNCFILDLGGEISKIRITFSGILGFSNSTESTSYGADVGGLPLDQ